MKFDAFMGPSYTLQSRQADVQRTVNLYPEIIASGAGKNKVALYGRPGLSVFVAFPDGPIRGLFAQDNRCFCVGGRMFGEVSLSAPNAGVVTHTFAIANDGLPVWMASNSAAGHQLLVISAGVGYIYNLNTNILTQIIDPQFPANALIGLFSDGYFLVLQRNTSQMWNSDLEDGTNWTGVDTAQRSTSSDVLQAIAINHRELWLFGNLTTEVWYDTGAATGFPYSPIPGAFLEMGAFVYTVTALDNTIFWVGQDRNGQGIGFRADGYSPHRVTTSAVEYAWSQYATIADAEAYAYQEQGHLFWVVNFPTANKTWVYDVSTDMWHEQDWYNAYVQQYERILPRCHAMAFGLHLVGDSRSGNIYVQSLSTYDDNGTLIHRRRRAPHITNEQDWTFYKQFQLDCEVGFGTPADLEHDPQVTLRWSNDGGYTWSNDVQQSLGKQGAYRTRAIWNRLGRGRDRVFEVEITERMPVRLINAYIDLEGGTS